MSNLISRAAFIGKLLLSREGRGLLSQGEKALTSNVLQELVAGSAWFQGLPLSKLGDFDSYLKAATKKVWALWTCADLIAEAACDQGHAIRRKRGKVKLDVETSAVGDLIDEPNDWQTWRDLKYHTLMQLLICGNAFWAKDEATATGERPKRLIPLNPKRMSIIIDTRNGVIGYVYRPVYAQDRANFSQPIPFEPHEIVHFRKQNPDNDFWGLGAVEAGENLFNDFINEDTWRQRFWGRGALPTTLLTLKSGVGGQPTSIPEAKWKQMKANWEQEYGGTENAGKTSWLSGDWAVQRIGLSLAEMQSIEGRKWTVEQIAHQFKVPLSVLGLDSAANYACLPAGTLVSTVEGPKPIETLKRGMQIWQHTDEGLRDSEVDAIIPQGTASCYSIQTETRKLIASDNHPILVAERKEGVGAGPKSVAATWSYKWKRSDEIQVGDFVVSVESWPELNGAIHAALMPFCRSETSQIDLMYLLGAYIGDGSGVGANKPLMAIAAHENDGSWQGEIAKLMKQVFGKSSCSKTMVRSHGAEICKLIYKAGFGGHSIEKRIPDWLFGIPKRLRLQFLAGYVDADGTVDNQRGQICIGTTNRTLAAQFRELAISCGIPVSNLNCDERMTNFGPSNCWRFTMGYADHNSQIPLRHSKKNSRITEALIRRASKKRVKQGRMIDRMENSTGEPFFRGLQIAPDFGLNKVLSVVCVGKMEVFDLATLGASHTFIAEGIVTHNTANIDRRRFLEFAVKPTLKNFQERVNKDLIRGFDDSLTMEHDVSGLVSLDELAEPLQTLISNSVLTPNEARQVIGREKVDDPAMDRHYMTSGLTPIELNGVADLGGVDAAAQRLQQRVTQRELKPNGKQPKPVVPGLEDEEE